MMPKTQKKAPGILDLLGLAVGQVGMSIAEFSRTTPDEFEAIAWFYAKAREEENEAAWERMRLLATITIQPHVKKKKALEAFYTCRGIKSDSALSKKKRRSCPKKNSGSAL